MKNYIWKINKKKLNKTNLALYSNFVRKNYKVNFNNNFNKLWKWSINNNILFWKSIWDFTEVKGIPGKVILKKSNTFYKNKFFPKAKLNYTKNILKKIMRMKQLYLKVKMDIKIPCHGKA